MLDNESAAEPQCFAAHVQLDPRLRSWRMRLHEEERAVTRDFYVHQLFHFRSPADLIGVRSHDDPFLSDCSPIIAISFWPVNPQNAKSPRTAYGGHSPEPRRKG